MRFCLFLATAAALTVACSCCGSPVEGDDWLMTMGDDTITVSDAGSLWDGLETGERRQFLRADDPVAAYVITLARREMVMREIGRLGYLDRPRAICLAGAWVRRQLYMAAVDSAKAMIASGISPEDIDFYRSLMGRTVWYTTNPRSPHAASHGPVHLPEVPKDLALCLDTLRTGQSAVCGDTEVRLDSLYATDPELVAETLRDTSRVESLARNRLSESRYDLMRDSLLQHALEEAEIDTLALEAMASSIAEGDFRPDSTDVVVSGPVEGWTERKLLTEVTFASQSRPVDPTSISWLLFLVRNLIMQNAFVSWLQQSDPEALEPVLSAGQLERRRSAVDLIYSEMVAESTAVGPQEIERRYRSMSEPIMMPELRRLQIVVFPQSELQAWREALADPGTDPAELFDPYPWFGDTARGPGVTVPLERGQLPETMADTAFALSPEDTASWHGPFPVVQLELMAGFRLREILPPREATLEEASDSLREQIRAEKAESRLEEWMTELEQRYGLRINDAILDRLPPDPALWTDL
ncbi:MAG: hypothetical protein ACQETZ_04250 [Candidatus Fermentibacterota bacterium]